MDIHYGFGNLEKQLIDLFQAASPDFDAAMALLDQGADINAAESEDGTNILSEILLGYWQNTGDELSDCDDEDFLPGESYYEYKYRHNPHLGIDMCKIIRFFLDHGFDVTACQNRFGAQCLYSLTFSTFDRYMIDATKLLFDAGAKNCSISENADQEETPWDAIATEDSFQGACEKDYHLSNIFEAVYQIYQAIEDGCPYHGIDSYETATGGKILKVFMKKNERKASEPFISLSRHPNSYVFQECVYIVYDSGILVFNECGSLWVDTILPEIELVDQSVQFPDMIGQTIKAFDFDRNSYDYGSPQNYMPATILKMESGLEFLLMQTAASVSKYSV